MGAYAVLLSMLVILLMVRRGIDVGFALLSGSAVLILFAPVGMEVAKQAIWVALSSPTTWELVFIILFIGVLGYVLRESGALELMVSKLLLLLGSSRLVLTAIPSLIGLLTVPGGAIMSAPMVNQLGDQVNISPEHKTGVNIIFRHIWYFVFPMMSGVIVAARLAGTSPELLVVYNIPVMITGLLAAWFFVVRKIPAGGNGFGFSAANVGWFSLSIMPIIIVLCLYLLLGLFFPLALLVGILLALGNLPAGSGSLPTRILKSLIHRSRTMLLPGVKPMMVVVVLGIMVYKEVLTASSLVTGLAADMVNAGIPLWLIAAVLPFTVGMVTGSHTAAIGIVYPIFLPLLSPGLHMAGVSLMFASATLGYMISPLHLCLVLTVKFFGARLAATYRYMAPVAVAMLAAAVIAARLRGL